MDAPVILPYARKQGRSTRRRLILSIALGLAVGAAYWGYQAIHWRVVVLQTNPQIGPVDWAAVLRSPTLLKIAWELAANPKKVNDPKLFGLQPGVVQVELKHPFVFENGNVFFELVITNRGLKPIVMPPFTFSNRPIPRDVGCFRASVHLFPGPCLKNGVCIIDPGAGVILAFPIPADRRPANTDIIFPYDGIHSFFIGGGGGLGDDYPYAEWKDVPKSAIQARMRR